MTDNGICSLLGLAMRAGRLAAGDEPVRELARDGVVRAVFLAADAGTAVSRQAAFTAEKAHAPLLQLPVSKEELGGALGRKTCAMCAVSDSGFAAKAAEKLAALDPAFRKDADTLRERHARIQSRRGIKKHRDREDAPAEEAAARRPTQQARPDARQGRRPIAAQRRGQPARTESPRERGTAEGPGRSPRKPGERTPQGSAPQKRGAGKPVPRKPAAAEKSARQHGIAVKAAADGPGQRQKRRPEPHFGRVRAPRHSSNNNNNQPLADKKPTGPRSRRSPAIEHPRKLRR